MTTRLLFQFANSDLGNGFEIINPAVLPVSGEILDFKWEDYLVSRDQIESLRKFNKDGCLIAEIISKRYAAAEIQLVVVLHKDNEYEVI